MMYNSPSARLLAARAHFAYAEAKPKDATPSRTFVNSTQTGTYTGNNMPSPRPDAGQLSATGRGV